MIAWGSANDGWVSRQCHILNTLVIMPPGILNITSISDIGGLLCGLITFLIVSLDNQKKKDVLSEVC